MRDSKLDLFFTFIKGDHRISRKYAESKKGLPIKGLDLPLFRYVLSLQERIQRLHIIYSKIVKSHKETLEETQQVELKGYGSRIKSTELNIYYEVFFNEIYSILENVSRINLFMFENPSNISPKFSKQIKK
jgi:transposase